jgi:hypothetical protein
MEVLIRIEEENFSLFEKYLKKVNAEVLDSYPNDIYVRDISEVRQRVKKAEERIKKGEYVNEEQFDKFVEKLINEVGV